MKRKEIKIMIEFFFFQSKLKIWGEALKERKRREKNKPKRQKHSSHSTHNINTKKGSISLGIGEGVDGGGFRVSHYSTILSIS